MVKALGLADKCDPLVLRLIEELDLADNGGCQDIASHLNEEIFKMVGTCLISKPKRILEVIESKRLVEFATKI